MGSIDIIENKVQKPASVSFELKKQDTANKYEFIKKCINDGG
jgi:hypothetical protein